MSATATVARLWDVSLEVIARAQTPAGGLLAALDYPTYRYVWVRDGSFIAEAARVAGRGDLAAAFHAFVARSVLDLARGREPGSLTLPARFEADGRPDESGWPNFQLDGYGLWLWALGRQAQGQGLGPTERLAARTAAAYLARRWPDPCFDPWEEGGATRPTATLAASVAGLHAAHGLLGPGPWSDALEAARADLRAVGSREGRLTKDVDGDAGVDAATLWAIAPLEVLSADDPVATGTLAAVERQLGAPAVHRHLGDTYYGGGAWPLLSALWGLGALRLGDPGRAAAALGWIRAAATNEGYLPEQTAEGLLDPASLAPWEAERGPVATPLVWSHAMFILLAHALGVVSPQAPERPDA